MYRDSDISELIAYFVRRKDGFAYLKTSLVWLRLKTGHFEDSLTLTVEYQQRFDEKDSWSGTASTIAGFFPELDAAKQWLQSEEGFDKIDYCLRQLERISNKEPYEDWDW